MGATNRCRGGLGHAEPANLSHLDQLLHGPATGSRTAPARQRNVWRYTFLHPAAPTVLDNWHEQLRSCVRNLRAHSGLEPDAPDLAAIVGELTVKSPDFARLWDCYDIAGHTRRTKTFHHPDLGRLTLGYQSMQLDGSAGLSLISYPGSPEHESLIMLDRIPSTNPTEPAENPTSASTD